MARVRDSSQRAEGYPSQRGGKAVASLGLGLGLVVRPKVRNCSQCKMLPLDRFC